MIIIRECLSSRAVGTFVIAILMGLVVTMYVSDSSGLLLLWKSGYNTDRSEAYNVKVIPESNDDSIYDELSNDAFSYVTIIDAGSSGCRAHVFRYGKLGDINGPLYVVPKHLSKKVKPGLSSFEKNPSAAGESMKGLVEFIKEQVPPSNWRTTPIWLMATAGLRMLPPQDSAAILDSVRNYLGDSSQSPFLFRPSWARIISGNEEGSFGWIAFNYMKRIIGPKRGNSGMTSEHKILPPYAVVEMGGASSQVTQMAPTIKDAESIPPANKFAFTVEGETFVLYTHSYLGYGAEQGREGLNKMLLESSPVENQSLQTIKDPCLYDGYTRPAGTPRKDVYEGPEGEFSIEGSSSKSGKCTAAVTKLFNRSPVGCDGPGPFSFGCIPQPSFVTESPNFLVFENFFYVSSALGVLPAGHSSATTVSSFPLVTTPGSLREAATETCSDNWETIQKSFPRDSQPKENNVKWCFSSSFSAAFLIEGLGLKADKRITVQQEVGGSEIEWAMGAAFKECADLLVQGSLRRE